MSNESFEEDVDSSEEDFESSDLSDESSEEDVELSDLLDESSEREGSEYLDSDQVIQLSTSIPKDVQGPRLLAMNYNMMDHAKKWTIESGVVFEDRLFQYLKGLKFPETSALAWALESFLVPLVNKQDTDRLSACFGPDTKIILEDVTPPIKTLPSNMKSFFGQFYGKDEKGIRILLVSCQLKQITGRLRVESYWLDWLASCLFTFFMKCPLLQNLSWTEHWFSVNWWGPFLDTVFQKIKGARVHRGEIMLDASQRRRVVVWRDNGKESSPSKPTGRRVDMKVQADQIEYFVLEASKDSGGGIDKAKVYHDLAKICQLSADMAIVIEDNMGPEFLHEKGTHVVACVVAGATIQFYGLTHRGYTCFFYPLGDVLRIPGDSRGVNQVLDLLTFVARIQIHLEELTAKLITRSRVTTSQHNTVIPTSTPKKVTKRKRGVAEQ
ncbi:MAG: hypothetical protein Q9180_001407 [Flavoplaca navasiana]